MSTNTTAYLDTIIDAIEHLPQGARLVIHEVTWDDYERLLEHPNNRPSLRVSYDRGRLEILSTSPEHEDYADFIRDLVLIFCETYDLTLETRGRATWKKPRLARGVEADGSYFIVSADRIIGKRQFDLEVDPPPDVVVEIDLTNDSIRKFPIYAALGIPEIWRYDGKTTMVFYELTGNDYHEIHESRILPGLKPQMLAAALEQSESEGQTVTRKAFRRKLRSLNSKQRNR
jgi:Uma2 family endonuclease